ncbi:hypothetical protein BJX76DRAFT_226717 [Aspergillus varians]
MLRASPAYLLGGAALLSTIIVTVVDGVCYGVSKVSTPDSFPIEAVTVSISIISCFVIVALILIWANESKIDARTLRKDWRVTTYGIGIGYLSIATGVTAGGIAWSTWQYVTKAKVPGISLHRQLLFIARCVLWAISVLTQGMLCGVILTTITSNINHDQWPTLASYELDTITPSRPGTMRKEASNATSSVAGSQRPSIDATPCHQSSRSSTISRRSTRYSGRTLAPSDSKPNSLDLNPTLVAYPESATTRARVDDCQEDPGSEKNYSRTQQLQRSNSQIKRSLDSVLLRPTSILSSSAQSEPTKRPLPTLNLPDESNIHPLFRSNTCSPPPTATPRTIVLASPEAGQTITVKTLQRMRSTRSVGTHPHRSRSPLFEQTDRIFEDIEQKPGSIAGINNGGPGT